MRIRGAAAFVRGHRRQPGAMGGVGHPCQADGRRAAVARRAWQQGLRRAVPGGRAVLDERRSGRGAGPPRWPRGRVPALVCCARPAIWRCNPRCRVRHQHRRRAGSATQRRRRCRRALAAPAPGAAVLQQPAPRRRAGAIRALPHAPLQRDTAVARGGTGQGPAVGSAARRAVREIQRVRALRADERAGRAAGGPRTKGHDVSVTADRGKGQRGKGPLAVLVSNRA
eukprot:363718-Chlamydomonas_euryale.AAC.6